MSAYNAKNYTEQGGEVTHIGGVLEFGDGASILGFPGAENQSESEATTVAALKEDFNGLLTKLKAAGLMAADEAEQEPDPDPEEDQQGVE